MQMPKGYNEAQVRGEFERVELGGHHLIIQKVEERKSSTGKDMIVVYFDFDKNDSQPSYFANAYKADTRQDKKWSNQATAYIMATEWDSDNCSRDLKTFCTCVEHSNTGFTTQWGDGFAAQFKGKKIGGVFGEQLDWYNNKEIKKRVLRWFCSVDKVADAQVPDVSESKQYKNRPQGGGMTTGSTDFMSIPDGLEEELPFN